MTEAVIVALITATGTIIGVLLSNKATANKTEQAMKISQAVTDTKIDELTREVRLHNGFAEKIPTLEAKVDHLGDEVKRLESFHIS